jgi:hypothetical protein
MRCSVAIGSREEAWVPVAEMSMGVDESTVSSSLDELKLFAWKSWIVVMMTLSMQEPLPAHYYTSKTTKDGMNLAFGKGTIGFD